MRVLSILVAILHDAKPKVKVNLKKSKQTVVINNPIELLN